MLWDFCPHTTTLALHGTTTGVELHCVCVGIPDYPLRRFIGRQVGPGGGTYTRWATPHVRRGNRWTSSLRSPTSFRLATIKQEQRKSRTATIAHIADLRTQQAQALSRSDARNAPPPPPPPGGDANPLVPNAGAGSSYQEEKRWQVHFSTKIAQEQAVKHSWNTDGSVFEQVTRLLEFVNCVHRMLPIERSSYLSYLWNFDADPASMKPSPIDAHLDEFFNQYKVAHPRWETLNFVDQAADHESNRFGAATWTSGGKLHSIGAVFRKALDDEVTRCMKGINDALPSGTGVLRPVAPQHIEGQDACTHATHIRREQYLTLDNEIAGLIVMMITPDPKSGDEKPSFYSRCADVLKSECDDGGKSFRIMSIMATAQPTAHSVLVRKHANHWEDCKYQHGYALHDYFEFVLVKWVDFMKQHGQSSPTGGYATWDLFIWYRMASVIRKHFIPERSQMEPEYYRQIALIQLYHLSEEGFLSEPDCEHCLLVQQQLADGSVSEDEALHVYVQKIHRSHPQLKTRQFSFFDRAKTSNGPTERRHLRAQQQQPLRWDDC